MKYSNQLIITLACIVFFIALNVLDDPCLYEPNPTWIWLLRNVSLGVFSAIVLIKLFYK